MTGRRNRILFAAAAAVLLAAAVISAFVFGAGLPEEKYKDSYEMYDIRISCAEGLDEENLSAIRALPCVEKAESLMLYTAETEGRTVSFMTAPQLLCRYELVSGTLPDGAGQIAVSCRFTQETGLGIGDSLCVKSAALADETLTVTGIVSGALDCLKNDYAFAAEEEFTAQDRNTVVLTVTGAAVQDRSSDKYAQLIDRAETAIEDISEDEAGEHYFAAAMLLMDEIAAENAAAEAAGAQEEPAVPEKNGKAEENSHAQSAPEQLSARERLEALNAGHWELIRQSLDTDIAFEVRGGHSLPAFLLPGIFGTMLAVLLCVGALKSDEARSARRKDGE